MVSVIIPTYNRAGFLKKALDSVVDQSFKDFELIVIDDGSTDSTKELIREYRDVIYIYQENRGQSSARNKGIRNSRYDFVAFLDSDDWWHKDKLKVQFDAMKGDPRCLVSHTQEIWYRNSRLLNQKEKHRKNNGFIFERCLSLCCVGMSTVMARKELFNEVGLFDENMPCCEDYDFWLRVSIRFPFLLINKPLTLKNGGRPDQVSRIFAVGIDKFRIESIKGILESGILTEKQRKLAYLELKNKCLIYARGCKKHGKEEEGLYYLGLQRRFN